MEDVLTKDLSVSASRGKGRAVAKLAAWLLLLGVVGYLFKFTGLGENLDVEAVRAFVDRFGFAAPVVFVALYSFSMTLLLPSLPFAFLGSILFGVWGGTAANLASAALGATLSFYTARLMGRDFVLRFFPRGLLQKINRVLDREAFVAVFLLRVLPVFPYAAVSFALGLTRLTLRNYLPATMLGALPWTFAYTYLFAKVGETALQKGVRMKDFLSPDIAVPFALVAVLSIVGVVLKKKFFPNKRLPDPVPVAVPREDRGKGSSC